MSVLDRFNDKWHHDGDCWIWHAALDKRGYGKFQFRGKPTTATRVSLILFRGGCPDHLCALHRCDNPACVNPEHLFLGTRLDNAHDMMKKGRAYTRKTGPNSPLARLNHIQCQIIRRLRGRVSQRQAAKIFGVSPATIATVMNDVICGPNKTRFAVADRNNYVPEKNVLPSNTVARDWLLGAP